MAELIKIKNPVSGEEQHIITSPNAVVDSNGRTLTENMGSLADLETIAKNSLVAAINEIARSNVQIEGHIRVSGTSDPAFSQKFSRLTGESVFDCIKPCLVEVGTGKLLHVLNPINWNEDIEGNTRLLDGSEGEVMICNTEVIHAIIGHHTYLGVEYDVFLFAKYPFSWNGKESTPIQRQGHSASYCVKHTDSDNVIRLHSVYNPNWDGDYSAQQGIVGAFVITEDENGNIVETYDADAAIFGSAKGLHSTSVALYNAEQYAMNLNSDPTKTVPFYNTHAACIQNFLAAMIAEGGTWDVHKYQLFGSGFSSNDAATNANDWLESATGAKNGFRYIKSDGETWGYYSLGSNANFGYGATGDNLYKATMLNLWRQPWKCLEQQRVMSYAMSHHIPALQWFAFEGHKYKWRNIGGFAGPDQGVMTCVVFKHFASKLVEGCVEPGTTNDVSGNRCEFLISSALYRGLNTDVSPSWWTSGLVFTEDENGDHECWYQPDQSKLVKTQSGDFTLETELDFENPDNGYIKLADLAKGSGYMKDFDNRCLFHPKNDANKSGAGLHTYIARYGHYSGTNAPAGKKSVRGFRRGGSARGTALSAFFVYATYAPSNASSYYALGTCCQLTD